MSRGRTLAAAIALGLALAGSAHAGSREIPEKLKQNGFVGSLEEGMKKAKQEKKVILLYVTPSYFT